VFLTLDDILESHLNQIDTYGGCHGIRDIGLLESAIAPPEASFGGQYLHADIFEMAAACLYHLVMNHPFVDGNKRIELEAALIFLEINNENLKASDQELVDLVLSQTSSDPIARDEVALFSPYPRRSVRDLRRQERVGSRGSTVPCYRKHSDGLEELEPTDRNDATPAPRRCFGLATIVPLDAS